MLFFPSCPIVLCVLTLSKHWIWRKLPVFRHSNLWFSNLFSVSAEFTSICKLGTTRRHPTEHLLWAWNTHDFKSMMYWRSLHLSRQVETATEQIVTSPSFGSLISSNFRLQVRPPVTPDRRTTSCKSCCTSCPRQRSTAKWEPLSGKCTLRWPYYSGNSGHCILLSWGIGFARLSLCLNFSPPVAANSRSSYSSIIFIFPNYQGF